VREMLGLELNHQSSEDNHKKSSENTFSPSLLTLYKGNRIVSLEDVSVHLLKFVSLARKPSEGNSTYPQGENSCHIKLVNPLGRTI
jgi:hypothetical protein